jgi:4'-phosphopantetheinyl transferase
MAPETALALIVPHLDLSFSPARARTWSIARTLLGRWSCRGASSIAFVWSREGKPRLAEPANLWFSLSHASRYSLIVFSRAGEVGCDFENRLSPLDSWQLRYVALHPDERSFIKEMPAELRPEAFARCWTRKEALLKAQGTGFRVDPTLIDVQPATLQPVLQLGALGTFTVHDGPTFDGGAAAVACIEPHCEWKVMVN